MTEAPPQTVVLVYSEQTGPEHIVECRVLRTWSTPHFDGWMHCLFVTPTATAGEFEAGRFYVAHYFGRSAEPSLADLPKGDEHVGRFKASYDASFIARFEPGDHFDRDFVVSVGIHASEEALREYVDRATAILTRR